jgi:hypothetical protein
MSISSSATLVELNVSVWTGAKEDKNVSRDVANRNAASDDAGKYKKNLMAGTTKRKEIQDLSARIREWHNRMTIPWADKGARLLPTSMFLEYKRQLDSWVELFDRSVQEFVGSYTDLVDNAKLNLGNLFNAADYPTAEEIGAKFGVRYVFSPVPTSGDFRLDIPTQQLDQLRADYDTAFDNRLEDAMKKPWNDLHKMLTDMSAKFKKSLEQDGKKMRWHDTFVTNGMELCQLLSHFNLTNDPKLEQARREVEAALSGLDIEDIKHSTVTQADTKDKVDNILKSFW